MVGPQDAFVSSTRSANAVAAAATSQAWPSRVMASISATASRILSSELDRGPRRRVPDFVGPQKAVKSDHVSPGRQQTEPFAAVPRLPCDSDR